MSKAKKIIILIVVCDIVVWGIVGLLLYENMNNVLSLKSKKIEVEYGEMIPLNAEFYLKKSVDKEIIKNTKVTYKREPELGKEYDKIGRYVVKLSYKEETAKVKVTVRDTTKPEFNNISAFETFTGINIEWEKYIKAEDLSKTEIRIDASEVDIVKAGEYALKTEAEDSCGNKAKKEIKVTVKNRPDNMVDYTVSAEAIDGRVIVTAIIENDDGTYSNVSSSGSIGTNNDADNGGALPSGNEGSGTTPSGGGDQAGEEHPTEGVTEPTESPGRDEQQGSESPTESQDDISGI